jgi:hypothetical protein
LQASTPCIYFNDPQWHNGRRLVDYRVQAGGETRHGRGLRCLVVLSLADGRGQPVQRRVVYQIDTGPKVVIVPVDS